MRHIEHPLVHHRVVVQVKHLLARLWFTKSSRMRSLAYCTCSTRFQEMYASGWRYSTPFGWT